MLDAKILEKKSYTNNELCHTYKIYSHWAWANEAKEIWDLKKVAHFNSELFWD